MPSIWCGPMQGGDAPLPVVVFSHGLAANRSLYSSICCQLASHGYLVAALEHRSVTVDVKSGLSGRGTVPVLYW